MEVNKWKKKKEKCKSDGNLAQASAACEELANLYFREEKYESALQEFKEMAIIAEIKNNKMELARANRMIGEAYCELQDFQSAIKHQKIHLTIAKDEKNKVEEQRALATLGRTYFLQSESFTDACKNEKLASLKSAKEFYLQSLVVCEDLTNDLVGLVQRMEMRARLFLNLALVLDSQHNPEGAIDYLNKAVHICKKHDLWEDLYRCYAALGSIHHRQHDSNKALGTYDLAVDVAKRLTDKSGLMVEVLLLKAEVLADLPDLLGARQVLLKAYKLKSPNAMVRKEVERKLRIVAALYKCESQLADLALSDSVDRVKLYERMGDMFAELNNYSRALSYYLLMCEILEKNSTTIKTMISCYVSLAQTYLDLKDYYHAIEYFKKELVLENDNPTEAAKTSLNIADGYQSLGKISEMISAYESAIELANKSQNSKIKTLALKSFKQALIECQKLDLAGKIEVPDHDSDAMSDSDEESESTAVNFANDIDLDALTDHDASDEETEKPRSARQRSHKVKSVLQKKNEKGETPLHVAAINGNVALVKKLLEQGHTVDVRDYSGWTPLHEASNHGFLDIVELLVEKGASVNDRGGPMCDGVTPLLDAASNGCMDVMEYLLKHGASPLMKTNKGETVVHCLSAWRKRFIEDTGTDLNQAEMQKYNNLMHSLKHTLENAGQKVLLNERRHSVEKLRSLKHPEGNISSGLRHNLPKEVDDISFPVGKCHDGAASEYQSAINALRNRGKGDSKKVSPLTKHPTHPALLAEENFVGDDWLENDLDLRPVKKRRTEQFVGQPLRQPKAKPVELPRSPESGSSMESWPDDSIACTPTPQSSPSHITTDDQSPSTSGSFSNKLKAMNSQRRKQISLMSAGVSSEKIKKPEMSSDQPSITCLPDFERSPQSSTRFADNSFKMSSVNIRIEGKLFLVPVPTSSDESHTIGWLASEAAKRYKAAEGVEPSLRLTTEDGALLSDLDPISLIFSSHKVLVGEVKSWKLDPLTVRYADSCAMCNINPHPGISKILRGCEDTFKLSVEHLYLSVTQLTPMLIALSYHQPLSSLNLCGNNISDQGISMLCDCLIKLTNLQELNLSNINLTLEGLTKLSSAVVRNRAFQNLKSLNLNFNPLNDCLKPLAQLIDALPNLTELNLSAIHLSSQSFRSPPTFSLDRIQSLDLSHNEIGSEGVNDILGRLDPSVITSLNLCGTGARAVREVAMYLEQFCPPNLASLDLSYCLSNAEELQMLINAVKHCPSLSNLQYEGNNNISGVPIDLFSLPLQDIQLCGTKIVDELQVLPQGLERLSISSCSEQSWAQQGPYGLCHFSKASKRWAH